MEKGRKILIINDDGIEAGGLKRLAAEALKYGEVWVVAPDGQRSACSHGLTINDPIDIYPVEWDVPGVHAYSCSGLPTDCFRVGSECVMPERPDVVFSGINNGFNAGTDIQYSATVGAALDAAMCGYPVVAFSEGFLLDPRASGEGHKVTDKYLPEVMAAVLGKPDGKSMQIEPGKVINVNFPDCAVPDCKGILWGVTVSMNTPYVDHYRMDEELPGGGKRYSIHWVDRDHADEGTDLRAIIDGYVAVGYVNNIS